MSLTVLSPLVDYLSGVEHAVGSFTKSFGTFVLLGVLFHILTRSKAEPRSLWAAVNAVIPASAHRHASSWIDYWNFGFNNLFLYGVLFSLVVVSGENAQAFLTHIFGPPRLLLPGGWITVSAQFVVIALATDFGGFMQHYVLHRFQLLWRIHRCHHSAEVLTPFTTTRAHPIETLEQAIVLPIFPGIATGLMLYFSGQRLSPVTTAMIAALLFFRGFMENFRHSSLWVSYGWHLNHVFYCPAMHQIHHSALERHHDKNMGDILSVWDWLFGTLYVPKEREIFPYGLSEEEIGGNNPHRSLRGFYLEPAVSFVRGLLGIEESRPAKQSTPLG
jgi:sterol desaturase/sphingolipid hydroxylase (fatty acid hydroxylase superfamily)